ncbi:MAG: SRPBCC family protein [Streptosporangiaceae bacterium]|nr:SRPBCC family protein [Streptosporangiaceae bacterium]
MAMELDNSFTVPVPPEVAWDVLLDVARIAPCMPGATVDEVDGDVVTGRIKVKVGPVSLTYKGTAKFHERDEAARTIAVEASGKESRGAGTASATVRASLEPADDGATLVTMHTTMNVTGRPAQFGRGVMVEVAGKLVGQFADNLARQLAADTAAPTDNPTTSASTDTASSETASTGTGDAGGRDEAAEGTAGVATAAATQAVEPARDDSINLVRLVGPAILKRVVPIAAVAAALALAGRRIRRAVRRGGKA